MKSVLVIFALLALTTIGSIPSGPTPVTLVWDPQLGVDGFYIYSSTNAGAALPWPALTNCPGSNNFVSITMQPGQRFFYVTASNFWGESGPSNITNTPVLPVATNLTIHR